MPTNRKKKVRARRARTGESYQGALRSIRSPSTSVAREPRRLVQRFIGWLIRMQRTQNGQVPLLAYVISDAVSTRWTANTTGRFSGGIGTPAATWDEALIALRTSLGPDAHIMDAAPWSRGETWEEEGISQAIHEHRGFVVWTVTGRTPTGQKIAVEGDVTSWEDAVGQCQKAAPTVKASVAGLPEGQLLANVTGFSEARKIEAIKEPGTDRVIELKVVPDSDTAILHMRIGDVEIDAQVDPKVLDRLYPDTVALHLNPSRGQGSDSCQGVSGRV